MHLAKFHGLGNDFLVALAADNPDLQPNPTSARELCDRHTGVGADGLIFAVDPGEQSNDAQMVLLNADGSRAEISGNGIRCFAQALLRARQGAPETGTTLRVETDGGLRAVTFDSGDLATTAWLTVDMGTPTAGPEVSPAAAAYPATHVATIDIGNPHLVLCVEDPDAVDLELDGPRLEADYPDGINVHFVAPRANGVIDLRVWERGAGVTLACGSGAVAAAAAAHGWGLADDVVEVRMPGGSATVSLDSGTARLSGPSTYVAEVITP